jgi:hypothetical protein
MEEHRTIPASISYRELQAFAQTAPAEPTPIAAAAEGESAAVESALEAWSRASQQLLRTLQQAGPAVAAQRSPRQLMALGALQAHVAMGLQALASSRRPQG